MAEDALPAAAAGLLVAAEGAAVAAPLAARAVAAAASVTDIAEVASALPPLLVAPATAWLGAVAPLALSASEDWLLPVVAEGSGAALPGRLCEASAAVGRGTGWVLVPEPAPLPTLGPLLLPAAGVGGGWMAVPAAGGGEAVGALEGLAPSVSETVGLAG